MKTFSLIALITLICFTTIDTFALVNPIAQLEESKQPPIFNSPDEFAEWMTYYYLDPEPNKLPAAIKYYTNSLLYNKTSSQLPMVTFFATILENNTPIMEEIYKSLSDTSPDNLQTVFLKTLWLIDSPRSKEMIDEITLTWKSDENKIQIRNINQTPSPKLLVDPIVNSSQLDMLWSIFIATGDSKPIERIISALALVDEDEMIKVITGKAAVWSLGSNAKQHNLVYSLCKDALSTVDSKTATMLQEIIDNMDFIENKNTED